MANRKLQAIKQRVANGFAYVRGHKILWNGAWWEYEDGIVFTDDHRPCTRCGQPPTPEGYDACQGYIPGATSVCCGHGVSEPILMMEGDEG